MTDLYITILDQLEAVSYDYFSNKISLPYK